MRLVSPLDDLIGGKTSVRVLRTLSLFPEKEFTGRELALVAGGAPSKVIAELDRFRRLGLVTRRTLGRTHAWKANPEHALLRLLSPAFEHEHALRDDLMTELRRGLEDRRVSRAILFGSFARGDERPASDLDLLVVTRRVEDMEDVRTVLDALAIRLSARFGLRLSPILHAERELPRLRRLPTFAGIAREGRLVKGEPL